MLKDNSLQRAVHWLVLLCLYAADLVSDGVMSRGINYQNKILAVAGKGLERDGIGCFPNFFKVW